MAFADGSPPRCSKCHANHLPAAPCISSNIETLCPTCHRWHKPGTYCSPPPIPATTDEQKADWESDFSEKLYEATRHKGKP